MEMESLSSLLHRPFPPSSTLSPTPLTSPSLSFKTPKPSLKKNTLISASKGGSPAGDPANPFHILRKTTVLLTASAALFGCLSSPSSAKTPLHPFAPLTAEMSQKRPDRRFNSWRDIIDSVYGPPADENFDYLANMPDSVKEKFFEEYLVSHPDHVHCLKELVALKIKSRKLEEAITAVDRLAELEPTEIEWPWTRAHIRVLAGDVEGAKSYFEKILENNPHYVQAYHGLISATPRLNSMEELVGIRKRIEAAFKQCKEEETEETLRDFQLLLAQFCTVEGRHEEALTILDKLVKEDPDPQDIRPYLCKGLSHFYTLLRKEKDALTLFELNNGLVPGFNLAAIADSEKEMILQKYHLDFDPGDVNILKALINLKIKTRKLDDVIWAVDRLAELEPGMGEWPWLRSQIRGFQWKTILRPGYRLEDLAFMNRTWFNATNGSRFSLLKIRTNEKF